MEIEKDISESNDKHLLESYDETRLILAEAIDTIPYMTEEGFSEYINNVSLHDMAKTLVDQIREKLDLCSSKEKEASFSSFLQMHNLEYRVKCVCGVYITKSMNQCPGCGIFYNWSSRGEPCRGCGISGAYFVEGQPCPRCNKIYEDKKIFYIENFTRCRRCGYRDSLGVRKCLKCGAVHHWIPPKLRVYK